MSATIIDGKSIAAATQLEIKSRVTALTKRGIHPGLAVILVGDNPASHVYVSNKVKACGTVGMHSVLEQYPADLTESALLARIESLNHDADIHGILVQLPLPPHINEHAVLEAISPDKDVDGFHLINAGALMTGQPRLRACTPYGVMKMLEYNQTPIRGAHAVIVGASNIVGKPMAMMLLQAGATVTLCNSKTRDLAHHTRQADIVIAAVGRAKMITGDMIQAGATVIDVGINRDDNGKLCGDVDFDSVAQVAGAISPVPGGVGPMTITMLLMNTLEAAEKL
ncbi:bifunctional methylenetetrahydrofolate dehydrogenase/methenyltetrahydrofolate cyclohydrolase FolD [Hydromonas duriensis]|uniref:Bifunctional protein FolD n=1 Tax=Hydromonas duriensis TaxID=1527608 RepID=A0A4R6Y8D0_9BURK|nr:bifunctional methylenetetrahydrofolate dehydrogenase/methenyltetrahydrofolate cyclohydrolase FolD [Hydromonas duriensis]TDR31654.1 methenyltetrahydrofolate cyclohydrolase /5,10-methylenetetrahydrofolate dehydrogenase (NADP+) [Hydromonas duriensis]